MLLQKDSRNVADRTLMENNCQVQKKTYDLRRVNFDSKRNHEDYYNELEFVISFQKLPKPCREGAIESPQHFKDQ